MLPRLHSNAPRPQSRNRRRSEKKRTLFKLSYRFIKRSPFLWFEQTPLIYRRSNAGVCPGNLFPLKKQPTIKPTSHALIPKGIFKIPV